jgi:uncharacterized protein YcfL
MGPVLEMMWRWVIAGAMGLAVAGCSSDKAPSAVPIQAIVQAGIATLKGAGAASGPISASEPDAATLAEGRRLLEESGQPVIAVTDRGLGLATFMVPLGQNSGVTTWANPEYQTISLRDGVILATRGFGADLMSAEVPTAASLRLGAGQHQRIHYVLDGADQTEAQQFYCSLSVSKTETISILGKSYPTKRVQEDCAGTSGSFTNVYWFDSAGLIRQSQQSRVAGEDKMQLQAIID